MTGNSECETHPEETLTWPIFAASLLHVNQSENLSARLHVDLRRHASAICATGR
ncbi:putative leader peptide [Streptomyces agglomeratus]|uniref:putative leader peptide n=1 Tax=Streptomyces agglomeratus TaxID=285458 RepID=UPI0034E3AB0A